MTEDKIVRKLRVQLEAALAKQKDDQAITLLQELLRVDPKATRWPHKLGDLYRKLRRRKEAIDCYALAADLYFDQGFLARAIAMAKTVIDLDPRRVEVLARMDPEAARKLQSAQRPPTLSMRPAAASSMAAPPPRRAAVTLDDGSGTARAAPVAADTGSAPLRHPAVIPEDEPSMTPESARPPPAQPPAPPPARSLSRSTLKRHGDDAELALAAPPPTPAPRRPPPPPPVPAPRARAAGQPAPMAPAPMAAGSGPDLSQRMRDSATELTRAPDADDDTEVRFSDAPPEDSLSIELTEQELTPREQAPDQRADESSPQHPHRLSKLPLFPLFAEVSQPALIEMIAQGQLIELEPGALVVRRGDPADSLFGIVEGSVEIAMSNQPGKLTLAEGDVFGESCLLAGEQRPSDIVVRSRLVALRFSRELFAAVASAHPGLTDVLLELLTRRLLANLMQSSPLFQEFDPSARQELIGKFEVRRAGRGTLFAELGKASDGLYISLTGTLEVEFEDGRPMQRHGAGSMFGQASLLTRTPSDVRVRAASPMLVLRLPVQGFQKIAMQYPGMLAHLSMLADSSVAQIAC
jgi:CRP-like cAMP-binding protein